MLDNTSITQHVQLPFFADLRRSLTIPAMPPPSFMGHLPSAKLLQPDLIYHSRSILTPPFTSLSDDKYYSGDHFGSHQTFQSETLEWDPALEGVKEGCEGVFRSWISTARPRKYVTLLFYGLFIQITTVSFHHHYLTSVQY